MSAISNYTNSVSALGTDDYLDVSEKISSSPDVYESRKMSGATLATFIQTYAQNILTNDALTMGANRTHDLQGNVLTFDNAIYKLQGTDTSSVTTLFELLDGDTVPASLWDFRNNGDLHLGKDETTIYANDGGKYFIFDSGGSNCTVYGNGTLRAEDPNVPVAHWFVGNNGNSNLPTTDFAYNNFVFENGSSGITTTFASNSGTQTLGLYCGAYTDSFRIRHDTNKVTYQIDFSSSVYGFHKGSGHWFSLSGADSPTFDTGVAFGFENGDIQLNIDDATAGVTTRISPDLRFRTAYWNGSASVKGEMQIGTFTDTSGNYGMDFKNDGGTVRMKIYNDGKINMSNLPTSSAGLSAGDLWNNSGVINIV